MKQNLITIIIILFSMISCKDDRKKDITPKKEIKKLYNSNQNLDKNSIPRNIIDTTNLVSPDFFIIPENAYEKYKLEKTANWFISDDKKSKLYIVPYTDGSITTAVLTVDKIPDTSFLNLIISEGTKVDDYKNAIKVSKLISKKGITLGLDKDKVISIFGANYKKEIYNSEIDIYIWESKMKENANDLIGGLRPFILNGLEHIAIAYFKNNKLIAIIYSYEVP